MKSFVVACVLAGCGDNKIDPDGSVRHDSGNPDAPSFPAPPTLGAQIDRAGRPGIGTMLIGTFVPEPSRTARKDAYARASDPATWRTTMLQTNVTVDVELQTNLAAFDALDLGMGSVAMAGCGNALRYNGPPRPGISYQAAAALLADDQIYVDTSRATCNVYLALEIEFASSLMFPHMTCGGRMPSRDVIDVAYSVLAAGLNGLDQANMFAPRLHDGATAHIDVNETMFPFLGQPH